MCTRTSMQNSSLLELSSAYLLKQDSFRDSIYFLFVFQCGLCLKGNAGAHNLKGCSQKFSQFMLNSGKTLDEIRAATACKSMNVCCL